MVIEESSAASESMSIMPGNSQGPHSPGDSVSACFDASTSEVSRVI